jgi:NADH-quinone oxidoreductase subunit L
MHGDRRFTYFFAALSLFTASMLLLVVADNTLQLLVGWELVGLCSFMLIGHWWEEKPNSDAALKAFLTTRTGDVGLTIGVIMTFFLVQRATGSGSFNILAVNSAALSGHVGHSFVFWCALALFIGIIGKSGQFPLHTWLPDAMAGPTPVSALIHAATMVVAGVYLGARLFPVFWTGFNIHDGGVNPMALIGGITIIIGAALAFVQDDIKKVLAYSTISQLGYMVMGLGVGAWTAAVFHLFTHAFFKANLFLGAGSVSHSGSHHSFDMKKDMGGLRKYMPSTFWTFVIGTGALAGIFPLAGFWSKDEILATAGDGNYKAFLFVGLVGAFMTAAYMTRCVYLTFFGEYRGGHSGEHEHGDTPHGVEDAHGDAVDDAHAVPGFGPHDAGHDAHAGPHESPALITVPLWILTFMSITAGWLQFEPGLHLTKFRDWFQPRVAFPVDTIPDVKFNAGLATISVAVALTGIGVAYLFYWKRAFGQDAAAHNPVLGAGKKFLVNKYYLDALYTDGVIAGVKGPIAAAAYWVNQYVIDNVLRTTGRVATVSARFVYRYIDQRGVDGVYNGTAMVTGEGGGLLRKLQNGRLQEYALFMLFGVAAVALVLAIRF